MSKRVRSPDSGPNKRVKKNKTKYNTDWESEFVWITRGSKGTEYAACKYCRMEFMISNGGRNDVKKHSMTFSHIKASDAANSSRSLANMFQKKNQDLDSDPVIRAETLFAFFVAKHNLSFMVADHFTELVKVMFPDSGIAQKFKCKRTKTTHIVNQVLGPELDNKVTNLCQSNKFSIMIDESNDSGADKLLTVLVRVYDKDIQKITTCFLGMPVCNIGTAENIFSCLTQIFM